MLINGIELSSLGASLHNRVLTSNKVKTTEKWTEGSLEPTFVRQQDSFKTVTLQFLVTEQNEENAFIVMSNITMLLKRAIIIFDDMPNLQFDCSLVGETKQERLKNGNFILTVNLKSDYAKGSTEVHTTNTAATDSFNLTVVYYKDGNQLIANENVKIKSSDFVGKESITYEELGIRLNKYQEPYYGTGVVTNFNNEITYENLYSLGILIINYAPTVYYKDVEYYLWNGVGYDIIDTVTVTFTHQLIQTLTSIGQLINLNYNRPSGYKATCKFEQEFTFENIVNFATAIPVYYDIAESESVKDVTINYIKEVDNSNVTIETQVVPIRESDVVDGSTINSLININKYKPEKYYKDGYCEEIDSSTLITFDTLEDEYNIHYDLIEEEIYIEYYNGAYPGWNRTYTDTLKVKYKTEYAESQNIIESLNININKYKTDYYESGQVFNAGLYSDYDDIISIKVVQIYYQPKEYVLTVKYVQDDNTTTTELNTRDYVLTDMMFAAEPELGNLISINLYRPEGYTYDAEHSYNGEVSLSALVAASPITITYKPVAVVRTKSIVIKYIKQLASTFSTINTSVVTIEEASVAGGVKLKDLFEVNKYRPEYYNEGIVDGYSLDAYLTFDEIDGTYDVYYYATTYSTQVRYYTDDIAVENWIGSNNISYTVLSFDAETTLGSLGLNVNEFKPPYCGDGEVQPLGGALNFATLRNLVAINIIYYSNVEPVDPSGIDYPHRILFLQHNDYGEYEKSKPSTWTMNHAYINTGVIAEDISNTTVSMSTLYVPGHLIYSTTPQYSYLFGAKSPRGSMYIGYWNRKYPYDGTHSMDCYFIAKAGSSTETQVLDKDPENSPQPNENGFSRNTGIYASERTGVSFLTLTHTQTIPTDTGSTEVPIYLFACNNRGNYQGGISGVGITGCKIYKNGVLVRDFIPVAYYDLIGTQVAPSNCLYDKVTQSFFEDATGLKSFNIIDDEEYEDLNPLHKIGKIYINYYKDGGFFQNRVVYFRGNELANGTFDIDQTLDIDRYQPRFYGTGTYTTTATNINTFEGLNNAVFEVNYPRTGYYINMNYYKDNISAGNLLGSDRIYLTEDMFYQVPTFGQLFDLLKYKPEGYKLEQENIPYTQDKVTLERILQSQPYDVVYTECPEPRTYGFSVKYYKHKNVIDPRHPLNQYELIAAPAVEVDETEIIDGVYPEKFINFNLYKPEGEEDYWEDGVPFEWYLEDENLLTPDDLREEYIIVYEPKTKFIDIKYYTDEVDPDDYNLIASDTWAIKINDWGFGELFQIVDELPNGYINKYKPMNCNAGLLQNSDYWYTFDSLVTQGHLDIVYMTKEEPHDPDDDSFPDKVLFWYSDIKDVQTTDTDTASVGATGVHIWQLHNGPTFPASNSHPQLCIPWMNLGYTPKEIGRLAMQVKAYALADSCWDGHFGQNFAPITDAYAYFLGYMGAPLAKNIVSSLGYDNGKAALFGHYGAVKNYDVYTPYSSASTGWFAFRGHIPEASGFSKQYDSVCNVDGNDGWVWSNDAQMFIRDNKAYRENVKTLLGGYRLGKYASLDENLEYFIENDDHVYKWKKKNSTNHVPLYLNNTYTSMSHEAVSWSNALDYVWHGISGYYDYGGYRQDPWIMNVVEGNVFEVSPTHEEYTWHEFYPATIFNPTTMLIDAYHNYVEIYDLNNDQNPTYYNINVSNDYDLFTDRCKPKGPIRLFTTTNPDTGKPNIITESIPVKPWTKNYRTMITSVTENKDEEDEEGESGSQNQPGTVFETHGGLLEMSYNPYTTQGINCPWSDFRYNAVPSLMRSAVWSLKIWDRGKLVRDLIPVAQGDQIFDYIAPYNGLFDKVTEIFFGVENEGGVYPAGRIATNADGSSFTFAENELEAVTINPSDVAPLRVKEDPTSYGKMIVNYYDYDNSFLGNKWVRVPTDYEYTNIEFKDLLAFNDYKPSIYYHDGMLDTDTWLETDIPLRTRFHQMWEVGAVNVYYKQKQYTKTVVYYNENTRIGSKDFFFSQAEIEAAHTLADLGIDPELYRTNDFKPGVVMSDETIIASDDVAAFIDAPSPVVVYHKYTKEERPDLFYVEYYRGGAYEEEGNELIVLNSENKNYLDCDLTARVLNHNGLIKYVNHYHSALYEDEEMPYFIAYQVDVDANYVPIHKGPARAYTLLAHITDRGRYTIIEERNGWGRLKEYPKGWILLKYTRPIVGPGQNPDFDVPTIANVTIPFGTRLSITKMTIDRLWAYTPEYGSWIKTEEISFDQQGRLYSALGMKVFHLDNLNWSNINTFEDAVGDIQEFKPRFHDNSSFVLNGTADQATLSDLHSVDIVYPETIYPYVVKYYENIIDEDNILGRGAFSCSLSDWNPDWDTFLSTSYLSGYNGHTSSAGSFYRTVGKTETKQIPASEDIYILRTGTYNDISCYYVMWGGYVGYIPRSIVEVDDYTVHTISPVLYRDTPLTLTWDFYDLDRNLYRPDLSYTEGIMLWNPHTYDNNNLYFTFEEIITTGSQKVLYVPQVDTEYKAIFDGGFYRLTTGITNFKYMPTDEEPGVWDFEIKYKQNSYSPRFHQMTDDASTYNHGLVNEVKYINNTFMQTGEFLDYARYGINANGFFGNYNSKTNWVSGINATGSTSTKQFGLKSFVLGNEGTNTNNYIYRYYNVPYRDDDVIDRYYNIINISNKRPYKQAIAQIVGINNWESPVTFIPRERELGQNDERPGVVDLNYLNIGAGVPCYDDTYYTIDKTSKGEFYYVKVWHNYELIHYYIPLPQGYWLPNGTQAPNPGFYDLITQAFVNEPSKVNSNTNWDNNTVPTISKGASSTEYDYFANWQFDIEEVNYSIKLNQNVDVYRYPDVLSKKVATIEKNTEIPVKQLTQDSDNHVQGVWYNIKSGWIKAEYCSLINDLNAVVYDKVVALKGDTSNTMTEHYGYLRPDDAIVAEIPANYFTFTNGLQSLSVPMPVSACKEIELQISGKLAPVTSSSSYANEFYGYLIGSNQFILRLNVLNASTTRTDVVYNIRLVKSLDGTYFTYYINGVESGTINVNTDVSRTQLIRIGCIDNRYSGSSSSYYYGGQANVNYHYIRAYSTDDNIYEYRGYLVYNNNEQKYEMKVKQNWYVFDLTHLYRSSFVQYDESTRHGGFTGGWEAPHSASYIFPGGDFSPVEGFVPPIGSLNTFRTEKTERVFYSANDFYWNGKIWIPAAYTDDYKEIWDTPKTYVSRVSNAYTYKYPIQETVYRKTNYLAGDRFTVIGNLGKDESWYLLDNDGGWVFNNDTFTELET